MEADGHSYTRPAISGDGRFVAFTSFATQLVPDDTNRDDIFVRDLQTRTTDRVSVSGANVAHVLEGSAGPRTTVIHLESADVAVAVGLLVCEGAGSDRQRLRHKRRQRYGA